MVQLMVASCLVTFRCLGPKRWPELDRGIAARYVIRFHPFLVLHKADGAWYFRTHELVTVVQLMVAP